MTSFKQRVRDRRGAGLILRPLWLVAAAPASPRLRDFGTPPLDPRYQTFRAYTAKPGYQGLVQRKLGSRYYYALGMHLALLLDRADPSWKKRVGEQSEWLVSLARAPAPL